MKKPLLLLCLFFSSWLYAQVPYVLIESDVLFENGEIKDYYSTETDIIIPPFLDGQKVTSIGNTAFYYNSLTNVTLPSTVTSIGTNAFGYNTLSSFVLPTPETPGSWDIGTAGMATSDLTTSYTYLASNYTPQDDDFLFEDGVILDYYGLAGEIIIPNTINGEQVTSIGSQAFREKNLTSVTIPNSVTTIRVSAFFSNSLQTVTIPNSVTRIGSAAFSNNGLTSVTIPNSVTTIENNAFTSNSLTSVTIPNSVTTIASYAFSSNSLTSVTIPNSVTTIGSGAFYNNSLTSVTIPNSVTSIGASAFNNNILTSFVLPTPVISGAWDVGTAGASTSNLTTNYYYIASNYTPQDDDFLFENGTILDYYGLGGDIIIPNTINGEQVTGIENNAFTSNGLTSVSIPNSVTRIGSGAFSYNSLTSVTIPNLVTTIESLAFAFNSLTSVSIPNSVTTIESYAFTSNSLTSVTIPNSVTKIGSYAFYNNSLTSFVLPTPVISGAWDVGTAGASTSNLTTYYYYIASNYTPQDDDFLFENGTILDYYGLKGGITIPSTINGEPVTSIGASAFYNNSLTSVTIPNSVTSIGASAFSRNSLTSVTISNSVISIGSNAFSNNSLMSVTIPNSVTSIGDSAFRENSLASVTIPNSVTGIGFQAFYSNTLTSFVLPTPILPGAWNYGTAGEVTTNLSSRFSYIVSNYTPQDDEFLFENGTILDYYGPGGEITIPNTINGEQVTSIGTQAFYSNSLTSVTMPNSVTSIGNYAFQHNSLESVTIPNSVISIGDNAFSNNSLTSVTIPNSVTSIESYAFANNSLASMTIPDSVTFIGSYAFNENSLESITISNSVTSIETYAFANNSLESITIPNSVTSIESYAFAWNNLTSVTIPNAVINIGYASFAANSLTSVTISNSVTSIESYAFNNNTLSGFALPTLAPQAGYTTDGWIASNGTQYTNGETTTDKASSYKINRTAYTGKLVSVLLEGATGTLQVTGDQSLSFTNFGSANIIADAGQDLTLIPNAIGLQAGYGAIPEELVLTDIQDDITQIFTVGILTYDITYNLDGGSAMNPATYTVETPTITLADAVKTNYTFEGWFTEDTFTNEVTEITLGSTGDLDLYAKFSADIYDITYNLDGGSAMNPATYTVETPTITLTDATKTDYTFEGWFTEDTFMNEVSEITLGSAGDVDLYAKFELILSVNDQTIKNVRMYPNPSNGHFTLDLADQTPTNIVVYDLTGKFVTKLPNQSKQDVHTNVSEGIYILHIETETASKQMKLVIKK